MLVSELKEWLGVLALLISVGGFLYAFLTKGSDRALVEVKTLGKEVDEIDGRVQTLENDFRHLPDKDIVHRLEISMKDMQVQMAGMAASSEATARTARRVEEFLLQQANKT